MGIAGSAKPSNCALSGSKASDMPRFARIGSKSTLCSNLKRGKPTMPSVSVNSVKVRIQCPHCAEVRVRKERKEAGLLRRKEEVHAYPVALIRQPNRLKSRLFVIGIVTGLPHQRDFDRVIPWAEERFFAGERFFKRRLPQTLEIDGVQSDQKRQGTERVDDSANLASSLVRNPSVDAGNCVETPKG